MTFTKFQACFQYLLIDVLPSRTTHTHTHIVLGMPYVGKQWELIQGPNIWYNWNSK